MRNWLLALSYVVVLYGLLLAPFDFHFPLISTDVRWILERNGAQITSTAGIRSTALASKLYNAIVPGDGLTIEAWLATGDLTQKGPARIVSYSLDKYLRNFTLGQEKRVLAIRLRTENTDLNGKYPEIRIEDVFRSYEPKHIVVTYDYVKEQVYIDGEKKAEISGPGGRFSNWDPSYPLVLGNEATGNRPWRGNLFLVAIYNRPLSDEEIRRNYEAGRSWDHSDSASMDRVADGLVVFYAFDEGAGKTVFDQSGTGIPVNLQILSGYEILKKEFLSPPYKNFRFTFRRGMEVMFNIIIFIPLGFLMHAAAKRRSRTSLHAVVYVMVTGIVFILGIESIQYFSITRHSSMTDVIHNVMGVGLGITIDRSRPFYRGWLLHLLRANEG